MSARRNPDDSGFSRETSVRVRSADAILATLDERGRLDGLPFMPEMLRMLGQTAVVRAPAHKTCDSVDFRGLRKMTDTVHLDDLRCDGSEHGGCQAGCLIFWKESWLEPISATPKVEPGIGQEAKLSALSREMASDKTRYYCQATELPAASQPLGWWSIDQYVRDVKSGNVGAVRFARGVLVLAFNKYQALSKRLLPPPLRIRDGQWYPFIIGESPGRTPSTVLDLQPGELVEVKSKEEILATLDSAKRNRGLSFDVEMLPYCGQRFEVLRRVERIVNEKTGELQRLPRDCIVLAGVTCQAIYHRFCPRAIYPYWREIWLKRVEQPVGEGGSELR